MYVGRKTDHASDLEARGKAHASREHVERLGLASRQEDARHLPSDAEDKPCGKGRRRKLSSWQASR